HDVQEDTRGGVRVAVKEKYLKYIPEEINLNAVLTQAKVKAVNDHWNFIADAREDGGLDLSHGPSSGCRQSRISVFYDSFYEKLFLEAPETRELFKGNMVRKSRALVKMVSWLCKLEATPDLKAELEALADRHVTYGCYPHHYGAAGLALRYALQRTMVENAENPGGIIEAWTDCMSVVLLVVIPRTVLYREASSRGGAQSLLRLAPTSGTRLKADTPSQGRGSMSVAASPSTYVLMWGERSDPASASARVVGTGAGGIITSGSGPAPFSLSASSRLAGSGAGALDRSARVVPITRTGSGTFPRSSLPRSQSPGDYGEGGGADSQFHSWSVNVEDSSGPGVTVAGSRGVGGARGGGVKGLSSEQEEDLGDSNPMVAHGQQINRSHYGGDWGTGKGSNQGSGQCPWAPVGETGTARSFHLSAPSHTVGHQPHDAMTAPEMLPSPSGSSSSGISKGASSHRAPLEAGDGTSVRSRNAAQRGMGPSPVTSIRMRARAAVALGLSRLVGTSSSGGSRG
ncbi:unnamed protein product, partial [Discosporangium mesarthrocarpum]